MASVVERPAVKTLVLPFERQNLALPDNQHRSLFLNAHSLPLGTPDIETWRMGLVCEQGFRPLYLELQKSRFTVEPVLVEALGFAGALVLADRSKQWSRDLLSRAVAMVDPGASILVAGEKTSGIAPLRKWVSQQTTIVDSFSKYHAQAFRFVADQACKSGFATPGAEPLAGIFGGGKVDTGSALLASTFDQSIKGQVADFCAGTGYLAGMVREQGAADSIDLYEADYRALQIARERLNSSPADCGFHWHDLASEPIGKRYDWIVMNPPFHVSRAADPAVGQDMIRVARKALKPGGKLRLVANRQLPYEKILQQEFGSFRELTVAEGFKVLQA